MIAFVLDQNQNVSVDIFLHLMSFNGIKRKLQQTARPVNASNSSLFPEDLRNLVYGTYLEEKDSTLTHGDQVANVSTIMKNINLIVQVNAKNVLVTAFNLIFVALAVIKCLKITKHCMKLNKKEDNKGNLLALIFIHFLQRQKFNLKQ